MNKGFDKETFKRSVVDNVKNMFRRTIEMCIRDREREALTE